MVKSGVSKNLRWRAQRFCWNEGAVSDVFCKIVFVADLLGSQYLIEILQTSLNAKNSENVVKSGCLEKLLGWSVKLGLDCNCNKYELLLLVSLRTIVSVYRFLRHLLRVTTNIN